MRSGLGCLGLLLVLALLAWPIETLAQLLGWSDEQTGYVLLAWSRSSRSVPLGSARRWQ